MAANLEEVSYDILEWFPILYCQKVFKHLDGKDVLKASLVNKEWYKFTGEIQQAAKLNLVFRYKTPDEEAMDILKRSKRRYQNIFFGCGTEENSEFFLEFLEDRAGLWKSLTWRRRFSRQVLSNVLRIIEPSIEDLTVSRCLHPTPAVELILKPEDVDLKWTFPCLKVLNLHGIFNYYNIIMCFFRCTSLVKFDWPETVRLRAFPPDFLKILHNNNNLKEIAKFYYDETTVAQPFGFKLQKLRVDSIIETTAKQDFFHFLESQAQSLESLTVEVNLPLNQDCLGLILGMPKLSSLSIKRYRVNEALFNREEEFPLNSAITYFELRTCSVWDGRNHISRQKASLENLIRPMTNLKHLVIGRMADRLLQFLAQDFPSLESIHVDSFFASRIPDGDIFPNIKKFTASYFCHSFKPRPSGYNFASLVNTEYEEYRKKLTHNSYRSYYDCYFD